MRSRGISTAISTSTSTALMDAADASGLQVIGNVFDDPELAEQFGIDLEDPEGLDDEEPPEDYGAELGYRGRLNGYVSMPAAMAARSANRWSRAAAGRMRGDPGYFISSAAGADDGSGALFIDTDGRRVQHGDDF